MGDLFQKYGSMIIKKGSIFYHINDEKEFVYKDKKEKPLLFCTFHPSEWSFGKYIHYIKLEKDVRLLFMVEDIQHNRVYSALPDIIKNSRENLSKMNISIQKKMKKILKSEYFDGWFTSIENKPTVEIALFNDRKIFSHIQSHKMKIYWRNCNQYNNVIQIKEWGNFYKISFIEKKMKLCIHERYKNIFEKYKKNEKKSKFLSNYIFQLLLDFANIKFHS
jgi:hypothetical protein